MPPDRYKYFRVEARELLEQLGQGALDLEKGVPTSDAIARLLRLAHTLKGAARVVAQPEIAERAHQLEDLFAALRDTHAPAARPQIDNMLSLLDGVGQRVAALTPDPEASDRERQTARASPDAAPASPRARPDEPVHAFRPDTTDLESLMDGVAETQTQLDALRPRLDQVEGIRHLIEIVDEHLARARARDGGVADDHTGLVHVRGMMDELLARVGTLERDLVSGVDRVERELAQVRDVAARLRLVPANAMFRFLERAARDAAKALGKRVWFDGRGGDVRVDSTMLTIVQGALLQMVRNAVAHGIEASEAERSAAGKPIDGHVTVAVTRRGKWVSFVCTDDGRGVDFDAVRRMLQRKGVTPTASQSWDTDALLRLLLAGGISTSGTVTDVAGRGVGLDVVREAAERLDGEVTLRTEPGKGTTVELVVPFSIASFQALLVEAAGVAAAVPLEAVRRTRRVTPDEIVDSAQGSAILDGRASIPFASLHRVLAPREPTSRPTTASSVFIVEANGDAAAFAVDRILGATTIVTRPLPAYAAALPAIVGASLDAGGRPRLVLDPVNLIADVERHGLPQLQAAAARRSILVVDDSLTTRMLEQSILESAGYDVSLATSAEEGLEKARLQPYALFLVDVEMPGMDGFTFIEHVRADAQLHATPAILVTSRAAPEDRQRGRDVGAQDYIVKGDFDQGVLLDRIRTLVQ
jgi:two-component system, chemotaxis family, sensor kinase CheA